MLQFEAEDVLMLCSGGVVETFHSAYDRSFRTPASWLGVTVEQRKDGVRVTVGRAKDRGGPVAGPDLELAWTDVRFELGAADEPGLRSFLDEVARAAGRPGAL